MHKIETYTIDLYAPLTHFLQLQPITYYLGKKGKGDNKSYKQISVH